MRLHVIYMYMYCTWYKQCLLLASLIILLTIQVSLLHGEEQGLLRFALLHVFSTRIDILPPRPAVPEYLPIIYL